MNKEIRWGIIGCGDVAEVKSGPAFNLIKHSKLLAVMRRNADKAKDFAIRHKVPKYYSKVSDILSDDEVNAVYIATPPSSHLSISLAAIKAGKNIYLEKPMVLNNAEAAILEDAIRDSKTKVTVAHYRRALPAFKKVNDLIKSNVIGHLRFAEIRILQSAKSDIIANTDENWRVVPEKSGGGYFFDLAPHQIDLMLHYFGPVKEVAGLSSNLTKAYDANDLVSGMMKFDSGAHFQGLWSFNVSKKQEQDYCKIYGSKGMIEFSFYGTEVKLQTSESKVFTFQNPKAIQKPMIQLTVDYFLGSSVVNPCSIKEAAEVINIMTQFSK